MDDNIEMDNYPTDITTQTTKRHRKKRVYEETSINHLSSQLSHMSFIKKKFKLDSNNNYITELSQEIKEKPEHESEIKAESYKEINMELEREMVSAYYLKQNRRLNQLMFGLNEGDS